MCSKCVEQEFCLHIYREPEKCPWRSNVETCTQICFKLGKQANKQTIFRRNSDWFCHNSWDIRGMAGKTMAGFQGSVGIAYKYSSNQTWRVSFQSVLPQRIDNMLIARDKNCSPMHLEVTTMGKCWLNSFSQQWAVSAEGQQQHLEVQTKQQIWDRHY